MHAVARAELSCRDPQVVMRHTLADAENAGDLVGRFSVCKKRQSFEFVFIERPHSSCLPFPIRKEHGVGLRLVSVAIVPERSQNRG
jgi:hypothetical protein